MKTLRNLKNRLQELVGSTNAATARWAMGLLTIFLFGLVFLLNLISFLGTRNPFDLVQMVLASIIVYYAWKLSEL